MDHLLDIQTQLDMLRDMDARQLRMTLAWLIGSDPAAFEKAVIAAAQYIYPLEG